MELEGKDQTMYMEYKEINIHDFNGTQIKPKWYLLILQIIKINFFAFSRMTDDVCDPNVLLSLPESATETNDRIKNAGEGR